jgi:hypothetical protein
METSTGEKGRTMPGLTKTFLSKLPFFSDVKENKLMFENDQTRLKFIKIVTDKGDKTIDLDYSPGDHVQIIKSPGIIIGASISVKGLKKLGGVTTAYKCYVLRGKNLIVETHPIYDIKPISEEGEKVLSRYLSYEKAYKEFTEEDPTP